MKKIKIMLTAIGLLAVVGGALAFKAKKFSGIGPAISYCTQFTTAGTNLCTISTPNRAPSLGNVLLYVRVANGANCNGKQCTGVGGQLLQ